MNYKLIVNILGRVLLIEALLMLAPLSVSLINNEGTYLGYVLPMIGLLVVGLPLSLIKLKDKSIYAKEGFVIVALSWILMSLIGCLPFVINGEIPYFFDALFEMTSGFTTTGASILKNVEVLSASANFWRIFSHFIGGMGVLVFVLAVIPASNTGAMHIFRAEAPGPTATKFVSKLRFTARILYLIYIGLTLILMCMLLIGGMSFYDALLHAFSTAGTGGFSTKSASIMAFDSVYIETVIAVFMFLFGINFNVFYLILIGKFAKAFSGEELRTYFIIIIVAIVAISINLLSVYENFFTALRYSSFQVASIISTTGFVTADFNLWPEFSKLILVALMIMGACGGSTGGGVKVSRLIILSKSSSTDIKRLMNPRAVLTTRFEKETLGQNTISSVRTYILLWLAIVVITTLLLSLDPFGNILGDFTGTLACIGNVGPGLEAVGPASNFAGYTGASKGLLSLVMIAGRLEIFPMLILFNYKTWKRA